MNGSNCLNHRKGITWHSAAARICANDRQRKMIESMAREQGLLIPKPVTMYEATHGWLAGYKSKVVIDDLEACLQSVIPNQIDYAICDTDSCECEDYGKESER